MSGFQLILCFMRSWLQIRISLSFVLLANGVMSSHNVDGFHLKFQLMKFQLIALFKFQHVFFACFNSRFHFSWLKGKVDYHFLLIVSGTWQKVWW